MNDFLRKHPLVVIALSVLIAALATIVINVAMFDVLVTQGTTNFDTIATSRLLQWGFTDLTATDGLTITPAYTAYALDTAGAVTVTLAAVGAEGQPLIICNDDANAVIIDDVNLRSSDGSAITLAGANDWVFFIYQDSEWNEIASSADS